MIIYSPYIADSIPGFIGTTPTTVKVPFAMNPAVGWDEISGFQLQVKEYNKETVVATSLIELEEEDEPSNELEFTDFTVETGQSFPTAGQYYKFQLAYTTSENGQTVVGTFSSASIGKCIGSSAPTLTLNIDNNTDNDPGVYKGNVTGLTDKIYSYCFEFKDNNNNLIETSGEILGDEKKYRLKYTLSDEESINVKFTITTVNGYTQYVEHDNIQDNYTSGVTYNIEAEEKENYIQLELTNLSPGDNKYYLLQRTIDQKIYEDLLIFKPTSSSYILKDPTVEQGIKYYYGIRQVDEDGVYKAQRIETAVSVSCNYEDIYLTGIDGKTLKIRLDPKVSSFKTTIQEQKVDTLGSQYPFFFRNGNVKYKEFPLNGLISYHMDDVKEFMSDEELGLTGTTSSAAAGSSGSVTSTENIVRSTTVNYANIAAERKFRLAVLDWLNNGEPKLFRSPTEGVYVIRLMNISLSPNDTLGRMIYSFSANAYEVSDHDIETLLKEKLADFSPESKSSSRLGSFVLGISILGGSD